MKKCLILQLHADHAIQISLFRESCISRFTVTQKRINAHIILLYVIYKCRLKYSVLANHFFLLPVQHEEQS